MDEFNVEGNNISTLPVSSPNENLTTHQFVLYLLFFQVHHKFCLTEMSENNQLVTKVHI